MADEKPDLMVPLKGSLFGLLPREIFLFISNYFSLPELGKLRPVSNSFVQLFYEIAFFQERGKVWAREIFYTPYRCLEKYTQEKKRKEQLTKVFLRSQIHNSPQKIDLGKVYLYEISDLASFPEKNITLRDTGDTEFPEFYQTTLLNTILFKILNKGKEKIYFYEEQPCTYNRINKKCEIYRKNGMDINTNNGDFFEHCILYRFNMLPSRIEAKNTLQCFFSYRRNALHEFNIGVGCSDGETIAAMKKSSMALVCPRGLSKFLGSSEPFEGLHEKYGKEGNFTIWIHVGYALKLFLTNPIRIALYLLETPEYFAEDDFEESCEILLTEIEKFRGINLGVPDEGLDKLKGRLERAIVWKQRCVAPKQIEDTIETPAHDPQVSSYSQINDVLNNPQEKIINDPDAEYLQRGYKEIQIQTAIKTIEQKFKDHEKKFKNHPDNKANCQKDFKQIINSSDLNVVQRAAIFDHFKDRIELNRHRNPRIDNFFGIKNTTSWRETWKEIRDSAKQKLFDEVNALPETKIKEKRELLNWAMTQQPLFCDHRNNTVLKGAFGRTEAVRDIETKIQMLGS